MQFPCSSGTDYLLILANIMYKTIYLLLFEKFTQKKQTY